MGNLPIKKVLDSITLRSIFQHRHGYSYARPAIMYHYTSPPPGWSFDYMTSPPTSPHYAYYATQFASPYASPRGSSKRHNRKASYAGPKDTGGWHPGYGPGFYEAMPEYGTPPRKHDPVSASFGGYHRRRSTMSGAPADPWDNAGPYPSPSPSSRRKSVYVDVVEDRKSVV